MRSKNRTRFEIIGIFAIPIVVAILALAIGLSQNYGISNYHTLPATSPTILLYTTVAQNTVPVSSMIQPRDRKSVV